jgi:uncharacterized protein YbcV (DUF1398 family)
VVPDAGKFAEVEASLDGKSFAALVKGLTYQKVSLYLPPFNLDTRASLKALLVGLGMPSAFSPGVADFSAMTPGGGLYISEVIHEAFVNVAEKGTEAGAATAVVLEVGARSSLPERNSPSCSYFPKYSASQCADRSSQSAMTQSSQAIENLENAQRQAFALRPKVGGFPVLAEVLRQAGVQKNIWELPSTQSIYLTRLGPVVQQGSPLVSGLDDIPAFDEPAVIRAIRADQAGETTFPQFLQGIWLAGVVHYEVDFTARTVTYSGVDGKGYVEPYTAVAL